MSFSTEDYDKSLSFRLFSDMQKDNLEYTYRGDFTTAITDTILTLAESNLANAETQRKIRKKVYFIMVEGLQNMTRHQLENHPGIFVMQRKKHGYFITTGNVIKNDEEQMLGEMIDKINAMDRAELKEYARKVLDNHVMSDKGGAGLGLIEIAKKSGSNIFYRFRKVTDEYSFFYMQTRIPSIDNKEPEDLELEDTSLEGIMSLHKVLDTQNILLNFSGNFTQETLINLLSIIEKQLEGTVVLKMKVFNLMVEMLQNIVKHADNYVHNNVSGKHAIFYIAETDKNITFTTGNYILNSKITQLEERLAKINSLHKEKLNDYYNECLYDFEKDSDTHSGLGLIDIKIKSKNDYNYDFFRVDDDYSFFSLQVKIQKTRTSITPYILQAEKDSPEIVLDSNNSIFRFKGRSYMENAKSFTALV